MKYDFTSVFDRVDSIAVTPEANPNFRKFTLKEGFDKIPMWIADMNFHACPTIPAAVIKRTEHTTYGYFPTRDEYYDAIINWHQTRKPIEGLSREHIGYENGVLGGVASALGVFCQQGEAVLVHSPTYVGFTATLTNAGYKIVHSELYQDENNIWRMDYADMEKKIVENKIHTAIFCSPHNPAGRVWEREELETAMALFEKYEINIIADEIWSDIIMPGYTHIPTQAVSEYAKQHTVAMYAPSKTFNLAGLIGAYHIIFNKNIRERVEKQGSLSHYNSQNVLSMYALIGAYSPEGHEWADELCEVIEGNLNYGGNYIKEHFHGLKFSQPQGTYMLYVDCEEWCKEHNKTIDDILDRAYTYGALFQDGRPFRRPYALRINFALPLSRVQEAFDRLDKYVFNNTEW